MATTQHPWLPTAAPAAPEPDTDARLSRPVVRLRPTGPQRDVPPPPEEDRLPTRTVPLGDASVWWVGVHGGAGETTLAALLPGSAAAGHAWPVAADGSSTHVVLVAQSRASGLLAAQKAATQWASGLVPTVNLLGLVVVADSAGKLSRPLRHLLHLVSGGVPRTWTVPWHEPWRDGQPPSPGSAPRAARHLVSDITALIDDRQ